jgi:pimeloyl-ACP methyl ester carboxylesterase
VRRVVPTASIDGIATRYEVTGSGPPLLMFSPGGFDATLDNWTGHGSYRRLNLLGHLSRRYTCIAFDRRESGRSGGRVERVTWADYAAQGRGLLSHLGIERAHLMGGCVGCSIAAVFAVAYPETTSSMVLYSPAGGARYRITQHARFARHLAYLDEHGLEQVVALANSHDQSFSQDPRVGPWGGVIRSDHAFAEAFARQDADRYRYLVTGMARVLFDRDTVPGPEPEDLLRLAVPALVVPGQDASHATSAARYLQECLPLAEYWDAPVAEQTEQTAPPRVLAFLDAVNRTVAKAQALLGGRGGQDCQVPPRDRSSGPTDP